MTTPESVVPLLEVRSLAHRYGDQRVCDALSFTLSAGEIACLLGPSGCGKTTLLRCIAGFEPASGGEIVLEGRVVSRRAFRVPPEQRRIGMVFQDFALFPHRNVAGNVGFGLSGLSRAQRDMRVRELLEAVGLPDSAAKYPHELSGGQQQRVALARALAPRPRLLLLDEPFSNLDVELRERLALEVRAVLKAQGITAVFVTHDQREAFAFADVIGVMHAGRIVQWDTAYNLYHRPRDRFVADFVGEGVFVPGRITRAGRVELELGALEGEIAGYGATRLQAGVPALVDVLLRPDDVVHDDSSPVKAQVLSKAFRGAEILYALRLPSGARVLSLVPSHHNHPIGEAIGVRLATDHIIVFPRQLDGNARVDA
jgi:iron(III) transport system ATP-binding protein